MTPTTHVIMLDGVRDAMEDLDRNCFRA